MIRIRYTHSARQKLHQIADAYSQHVIAEIRRVIELAAQMPSPGLAVANRPDVRRIRAFAWILYVRHESDGYLAVLRVEHTSQRSRF